MHDPTTAEGPAKLVWTHDEVIEALLSVVGCPAALVDDRLHVIAASEDLTRVSNQSPQQVRGAALRSVVAPLCDANAIERALLNQGPQPSCQDITCEGLAQTRWRLRSRRLQTHHLFFSLEPVGRDQAAQQMVMQAAQVIDSVLRQLGEGFAVIDHDFRVRYLNMPASVLAQREADQVIDRQIWDVWPELRGTSFEQHCRLAMQQRVPVRFEFNNVHDPKQWYDIRIMPAPQGLYLYGHDITPHKQAQLDLERLNNTLEQRVRERTGLAERRMRQLKSLNSELQSIEHRERRRLAQVLHDGLQQLLVAASLRLEGAITECTQPRLRQMIEQARDILNESVRQTRSISHDLSPPVLHESGLLAALRWLSQRMQDNYQLTVHLQTPQQEPPIDPELRVLLFHAARELLFNIVKHAGVREAWLCLDDSRPDTLTMRIEDQGRGSDVNESDCNKGGFGWSHIRQRLEAIGGSFQVQTAPNRGCRICIEIPRTH